MHINRCAFLFINTLPGIFVFSKNIFTLLVEHLKPTFIYPTPQEKSKVLLFLTLPRPADSTFTGRLRYSFSVGAQDRH
jgi:hypothetical protein